MVKDITIKNFKSVKNLSFQAKKVNIFIGEPNTGKSNILEALGLFSLSYGDEGQIRYKEIDNLFLDNEISEKITVSASPHTYTLVYDKGVFKIDVKISVDENLKSFSLHSSTGIKFDSGSTNSLSPFKFYRFKTLNSYSLLKYEFLAPPFGKNLFSLLKTNKNLRNTVSDILKDHGYKLGLRNKDKEIEISKELEDVIFSFPYQTISDTIQRIIFYLGIIDTNKNSILLLEEPEAHTFPFYTKYLAERIALDESNQYFIVTHNPYFLISLVEKTNIKDLGVFVTYMEDYQTKVRPFAKEEYSELLDLNADIFFNLDKFLKHENLS